MVKRVYTETVKKWLIGAGITAGTLISGLFIYLMAMGVITITGYSGDVICAGTIEDPCYAYVNLTAEEDVFIYPVGYDPWGRDTIMQFDPAVKSWKLQRSWGKGWRDIPLNETCTGTWCGAPNNLGVKYSYVLREGRDYQFRIVGYKNSPYEDIKWSVDYENKEYLDPTWKGIEECRSIDPKGCEKTIIWNITKTGAEQEFEFEYEIKDNQTTKFCIKLEDKTNYENSISGDIRDIPIVKTGSESFNISVDSFNFSGEELEIDECFEVTYGALIPGMSFKIGWGSISTETVESTNSIGEYSSLALDSNGQVHIAHGDTTDNILRYCNGTTGSWTCEDVPSPTQSHYYIEMAVDSSNKVQIVHAVDSTDMIRHCIGNFGSWTCDNVTGEVGNVGPGLVVPAMAIGLDDKAHIIFRNASVGSGLTYCNGTTGSWTCETLSAVDDGWFPSIAINSTGQVHISHHENIGNDLWYCQGTYGDFTCEEIDADNAGRYSSIAIDSNDMIHISAQEESADNLMHCNGTAGSWTCSDIETTADPGWHNSIELDGSDNIIITHYEADNDDLRVCEWAGGWYCAKLEDADTMLLGWPNGRNLAIKKGRKADSSSYSGSYHISWMNSSDLMYTTNEIKTIDYVLPIVTLNSPVDTTNYTSSQAVDFNCTASDNINLTNMTFYWNLSGSWVSNGTNVTGINNSDYIFTRTVNTFGDFIWNCLGVDNSSNQAFAANNFSFTYHANEVMISDPTTASPVAVNSSDNITIKFNYSIDGVNQTSGVTMENVTIGGSPANIISVFQPGSHELMFYDTFTGSGLLTGHSPDTGDNWTETYTDGLSHLQITSNLLDASQGSSDGAAAIMMISGSWEDDQKINVTYTTQDSSDDTSHLILRSDEAYDNAYVFTWSTGAIETRIWEIVGGSPNVLEASCGGPSQFTSGDIVTFEVIGTNLTVYDGVDVVCTVLDNSVASGRPGVGIGSCPLDPGDDTSSQRLDDIRAYNIIAEVDTSEFAYIDGSWNVNVTVPTFESGLKDLYLNATHDGETRNDTETNAISYGVVDTCTCPGAGNSWEVDMEDNCNLTSACTLTTGNLTWIGSSGYFNCSANLNLSNRDAPPSSTIFYHSDGCDIIYLIMLIFVSATIFKKRRAFNLLCRK